MKDFLRRLYHLADDHPYAALFTVAVIYNVNRIVAELTGHIVSQWLA